MAAGSLLKPFASLDLNKAPLRSEKSDRDAATALRQTVWLSLLIGSVVVVTPAHATDHPARGLPPHAGAAPTRNELYAAVRAYEANVGTHALAAAIPAFARKYFGQAFKDNGYRMKNGTDDLRANEPAYWPLFGWLWKDYEVDIQRVGGQTVQQQGGISNGALVLGGLGSIGDKVSFRFVPIIYEDGNTIVDHGWIRYNQAFGSDWLNLKVGSAELDLPINPGREYNMGASRFAVLYAYSVPGSVSRFSVLFPQPGVEIMGHDLGSRNRYSVNLFNTGGAPRAHCVLCSPGIFGRVTHRHEFANGFLRAVKVGVFGAYATWPDGPDTSDLKGQQRLDGDMELWFGSDVLPFRATLMGITGRDDRALVTGATQDPKFNAGMLQLEYVPKLPLVFYGGVRHALELNSRFAWLLELTYWRWTIKRVVPGGGNVTNHTVWLGTHLDF